MKTLALLTALLLPLATPARAQDLRAIEVGAYQRYYSLYAPSPTDAEDAPKAPLLILLEGGKFKADSLWRLRDLMTPAIKGGFVIAMPQAVNGQWNDGQSKSTTADDQKFISALIDAAVKNNNADPKRVYIAGASNGGRMALYLACNMAAKLNGVAAVGATLPRPLEQACKPARPVSMLIINGTEDPLVPWDGAPVKTAQGATPARMSSPQTVEFWAQKNNCKKPTVLVLPDVSTTDKSIVKLAEYNGCSAPTALYALDGGGHAWPGVGPLADNAGPVNMDINAGAIIMDFFAPAKEDAKPAAK